METDASRGALPGSRTSLFLPHRQSSHVQGGEQTSPHKEHAAAASASASASDAQSRARAALGSWTRVRSLGAALLAWLLV